MTRLASSREEIELRKSPLVQGGGQVGMLIYGMADLEPGSEPGSAVTPIPEFGVCSLRLLRGASYHVPHVNHAHGDSRSAVISGSRSQPPNPLSTTPPNPHYPFLFGMQAGRAAESVS